MTAPEDVRAFVVAGAARSWLGPPSIGPPVLGPIVRARGAGGSSLTGAMAAGRLRGRTRRRPRHASYQVIVRKAGAAEKELSGLHAERRRPTPSDALPLRWVYRPRTGAESPIAVFVECPPHWLLRRPARSISLALRRLLPIRPDAQEYIASAARADTGRERGAEEEAEAMGKGLKGEQRRRSG